MLIMQHSVPSYELYIPIKRLLLLYSFFLGFLTTLSLSVISLNAKDLGLQA